ncbi:MAG: 7-carboxy-7-deazaguanine synthase [Planctomycetaceae bacterium]|nr:7-carboxy-7-deazaguanine synthase [Planctomycetaceae bacterium]
MTDPDHDSAVRTGSLQETGVLRLNEIFHSIQGESTWAGEPCIFVRLAGCHLRCAWCDTEYAFREGTRRELEDVLEEVLAIDCPLVELTGGEPLLQKAVHELERRLLDAGRTVLIETSGSCDISACDPRSVVIMDLKAPSSGESGRNLAVNLESLLPHHEVKFVIGDRGDYEWARSRVRDERLAERTAAVLFSPVFPQATGLEIAGARGIEPRTLAEWILEDSLPVRLQLQLHKFIWDPSTRGV